MMYPEDIYAENRADDELRLMKEATINAKQAGERGISAKSVKKVTEASIEWVRFLERR